MTDRPEESRLRRTFTMPDETPPWQRAVVAAVVVFAASMVTFVVVGDALPSWAAALIGALIALALLTAATAVLRRVHSGSGR